MSQEIQIPDYLKGIVDESANDLVSVGGSVPRISIKGRQFRFKVDGEEIHKQTEPIDVIVLGVVPKAHMAKTFYKDGYQPGVTDPPDCSSFLGEVPDEWISNPQNPTCRDCAQNTWGSATSMSGKKAKACKDSKRLMVIDAKTASDEDPTLFIFNVTIASLKALSEYGKFLISNNLPISAVVTTIEFVDSEFPQVEFKFRAVLNEKNGTKMMERATKEEWMAGYSSKQLSAPEGGGSPAPQLSAPPDKKESAPPEEKPPAHQDGDILEKW